MPPLDPQTTVRASRAQVHRPLDDEVVILHLERSTYFGANEVGARIWQLVQQPSTAAAICEQLVAEFEVEASRCQADVLDFLQRLLDEQLLEVLPPR